MKNREQGNLMDRMNYRADEMAGVGVELNYDHFTKNKESILEYYSKEIRDYVFVEKDGNRTYIIKDGIYVYEE